MFGSLMMLASGRVASSPSSVEGVADALVLAQVLGEQGEDAPGEGDVARLDRHPGDPGVGLDDRQERVRRQQRRLVGVRVDDGG